MSSHSLFRGILLSQRLKPGLLHCRQILYCLSSLTSGRIVFTDILLMCMSVSRFPLSEGPQSCWVRGLLGSTMTSSYLITPTLMLFQNRIAFCSSGGNDLNTHLQRVTDTFSCFQIPAVCGSSPTSSCFSLKLPKTNLSLQGHLHLGVTRLPPNFTLSAGIITVAFIVLKSYHMPDILWISH